jgi:hypothetical protein
VSESFFAKAKRLVDESQSRLETIKDSVDQAKNTVNEVKQLVGLSNEGSSKKTNKEKKFTESSCLVTASFSGHRIKIFSNAEVQIGSKPREKLLAVDGAADIQSKTGVGRAAAGVGMVALGALPLGILLPSNRGILMLTIVTDKKTHVLQTKNVYTHELKALRQIAATGNAALTSERARAAAPDASSTTAPAQRDIAVQLSELSALHAAGVLDDEEFTNAKKMLLGS